MLARLDPRFLDRLWFPLGEQSKDETRAEAARAGLEVAGRAESQEACFLAGGDYRDFLARHGLAAEDGPVVDEQGNELGRHAGFWRFTPGQRKGLGVAAGEPLYALRSEPGTNAVVVGPRAALATDEVTVRGRLYVELERAEAKLRYRSPAVGARVTSTDGGFRCASTARVRRRARPDRGALRRRCRRRRRHDRTCRHLRNHTRVEIGGRMTGDMITLTIPREEPFHEVAHLVLGGVAARLNLTFESIEDLETALEAVLERASEDGEVTVELRLDDRAIEARVGPFAADALRDELDRDDGSSACAGSSTRSSTPTSSTLTAWLALTKNVTGGGPG